MFVNTPIYVDTNVFMDFFEDRNSSAYALIKKAVACSYRFIISDKTLQELKNQGVLEQTGMLLELLQHNQKYVLVKATPADQQNAQSLAATGRTHYADALHVCIAEHAGVACIVTQNTKDFVRATKLPVKRPDIL